MPPGLSTTIVRLPDVLESEVGEEVVLFNPSGDQYIGLDPIGGRVWHLLVTSQSLDVLSRRLQDEFSGEAQEITTDLVEFIARLEELGLVAYDRSEVTT